MANERLSMRKTREILRLKWELGRSHRDVAASLGVGLGTVSLALERAIAAELSWPTVAAMSEVELDRRLYRRNELPPGDRAAPDFSYLHTELRRPSVSRPALLDCQPPYALANQSLLSAAKSSQLLSFPLAASEPETFDSTSLPSTSTILLM